MSFKMPSTQQVRELGDSLGIGVTESYANSFLDFIKPFADGYRLIASLSDDLPEIKYPRGGYYRLEGEENRHGAWIAKTHIKGANSGKKTPLTIPTRWRAFRSRTAHRCWKASCRSSTLPLSRACSRRSRQR